MLFLFGLCLAVVSFSLVDHKIRYKKQRRRTGFALIMIGASATVVFDQKLHDFFIWGFVVAWITGLQLWFNCEKYGGSYP